VARRVVVTVIPRGGFVRQNDINEREWKNRKNWHGGPLGLYASKDDDRAFVPKRNPALGVTVNWSTGTGIGFMIGVAVFIAVVVWLQATVKNDRREPVEPRAEQVQR
jgi:uncharacterized membrane protein